MKRIRPLKSEVLELIRLELRMNVQIQSMGLKNDFC